VSTEYFFTTFNFCIIVIQKNNHEKNIGIINDSDICS
jgi:hypothetical protein